MRPGERVTPPSTAGLMAEAQAWTRRPAFDAALRRFCEGMVAFHSGRRVANVGLGRTLNWAAASFVVYLDHARPEGVGFSQILQICAAGGLGGRKAVRHALDALIATDLARLHDRPDDARVRRLRPTPALLALHRESLAARLSALELVQPLWAPGREIARDPAALYAFLGGNVEAFATARFRLYDEFPEVRAFMDRACGYLILLDLLRAAPFGARDADYARASRLAEAFHVSRAHVRKLLAMAQAQGWLVEGPRRGDVALSPAFAARLRLWIGAEFVWLSRLVEGAAPGRAPAH